jgi:trigger factor
MADEQLPAATNEATDDTAMPKVEVKIEQVGPARKKLVMEVPPERIAAKMSESFASLQEEATLPGFRRGRAPMRLLEKRFGTEVRKEVRSQLIGESFSQAVEDNELRIIGEPDLSEAEQVELPDTGPMTVAVEVEVVPEFELPDLSSLEVRREAVEVTDAQVDAEINRYREMYGQLKAVSEEAQAGDYLTADVDIRDESDEQLEHRAGVNVYVPGESRKYKGAVAGIMVDELGKKLEGVRLGDELTLEAKGPEQHEIEALRGKPIRIKLKVDRVERLEPMPMEQLIQMLSVEDEASLRSMVRDGLEQRREAEQRRDMQKQISDALVEKIDVELPEALSARQAERILQRRSLDMMYRGLSQKDIEENLAELRAASQAEAQRELKLYFICDRVAREQEIEVTEAEVNGRITQMAAQQGRRPERVREELAKRGQLDMLFMQLREEKAIDRLLEQAKIIDVEPGSKSDPDEKEDTTEKSSTGSSKKSTKKSKKKSTKKTKKKAKSSDDDED